MPDLKVNPNALTKEEFALFQPIILQESGIYFNIDQKDSLSFSLVERMEKAGKRSFADYYSFLTSGLEGRREIFNLLDLITVGETDFFRTPAHFDVLREFILPEIARRKFARLNKLSKQNEAGHIEPVIKIWSAGCSTGEEPYTIAINALETIPQAAYGAVSVFTTDVNRERLEKARLGLYSKKAVRNLGPEILEKYFIPAGDKYEVSPSLRMMVKFARHNLSKDEFDLGDMQDLDIIFCRNVLIYFDLANTKKIIDNFYNCLNDEGYLFIGPAESLWQISNKFRAVEFPHVFIHRKQIGAAIETEKPFINIPELDLESVLHVAEELPEIAEPALRQEEPEKKPALDAHLADFEEGVRLFKEKKYDRALTVFDKIISEDREFTQAYFAKATILSNQAEYAKAVAELKRIIKVDNLFIEAYYLMGVLFNRLGDLDKAIEGFQKVIYINPAMALAYFNLGNIFYCQKRFKKAEREFRNASEILAKRPKDEVVVFSEDVTTGVLLAACKKNIETVKPK
ncbi:MAG: CheR family methyltransferase [Candidatus Omnitrophota bacterium]|nr:CheR family methyltransferase [Candidatus Omnitrophota bacterium]